MYCGMICPSNNMEWGGIKALPSFRQLFQGYLGVTTRFSQYVLPLKSCFQAPTPHIPFETMLSDGRFPLRSTQADLFFLWCSQMLHVLHLLESFTRSGQWVGICFYSLVSIILISLSRWKMCPGMSVCSMWHTVDVWYIFDNTNGPCRC